MTKKQLRKLIREEIQKLNEGKTLDVEIFWKGLPTSKGKIGRFKIDEKDFDKLESSAMSKELSFDVYDELDNTKSTPFNKVKNSILKSAKKHFGDEISNKMNGLM